MELILQSTFSIKDMKFTESRDVLPLLIQTVSTIFIKIHMIKARD
jgi:hypothetical protein